MEQLQFNQDAGTNPWRVPPPKRRIHLPTKAHQIQDVQAEVYAFWTFRVVFKADGSAFVSGQVYEKSFTKAKQLVRKTYNETVWDVYPNGRTK